MRKLLKYLIPLIVVVAFSGSTDDSAVEVSKTPSVDASAMLDISHSSISSSEAEICLPRQISSASTPRVQNGVRRINSIQRNNIEFTKAGKVINSGIRYLVQNRSIIISSSLSEPACRLISLGRLII